MGMSSGAKADDAPLGDMNTTPLIDVMLVLLVMFIVTLPIQTHAVKIDLPVPDPNSVPPPVDPVKNKVTIDPQGTVYWNGNAVDFTQLEANLRATKAMPVEPELQFQPDPNARYVVVDQVIAKIKETEISKFGFVGNSNYYGVF
jgi:biopolymer transport protein ExbD